MEKLWLALKYALIMSCFVPSHAHSTEYFKGGYNLKSISKSALAVTRTLMGEPPDRLEETSPTASGIATVQKVAAYQSRFWPCLYPKDMDQGFTLFTMTVGQADC